MRESAEANREKLHRSTLDQLLGYEMDVGLAWTAKIMPRDDQNAIRRRLLDSITSHAASTIRLHSASAIHLSHRVN